MFCKGIKIIGVYNVVVYDTGPDVARSINNNFIILSIDLGDVAATLLSNDKPTIGTIIK